MSNNYDPNAAVSNNTLAAICNVLFPGLGQMIQGRVLRGIAIFIASLIGYALFFLPGLAVQIWSIMDAANYKKN